MLVLMAAVATAVLAATGLAVDTGRLFIAKQETQTFVDAAALAAALELDSTLAGITRARTAAANAGNTWNMNTAAPSGALVDFGTTKEGPWVTNPVSATNYDFARVRLTVSANLYFLPIVARRYTQNVISSAVAGKVNLGIVRHGLAPYSAIAENNVAPNFGLTIGQSYTIQWPALKPTDEMGPCKPEQSDLCFVKRPCAGDSDAVGWKVRVNWDASTNGYWGFTNSDDITAAIIDGEQSNDISVGMNIDPILTNGNMASQAPTLDDRAQQDTYSGNNNVSSYLTDTGQNGRRLIAVPIVDIVSPTETIVRGFGQFLIYANGQSDYYQIGTNGNDPFCAMYAGVYTVASNNPGGIPNGTGAYAINLVK